MSSAWAPLLPAALVGTERHTAAPPPWPGAVGQVIAALPPGPSLATALLRTAGALALAQAAGRFGKDWSGPLPAPAGRDTLPEAPADPAVAWALAGGPPRLQHEVCAVLAAAGGRWPVAWLPLVLDLGRRTVALRAGITRAAGVRGRWLAAQRDDWRWAAGSGAAADDAAQWDEGTLDQRLALLQCERRADPAAAAARLAAVLPELPARERALLVPALAEELSMADEPLLDALRADRAREVRQAAMALLLRLPQAGWSQRAAARLAACVRQERGLLGRRWAIEPPVVAGDDWKADGLEPERPKYESLGERAWWLVQLVRQVPLAWWTAHTGLAPADLLRWAAGTDWAEALRRGWREVLPAAHQPSWCEAFLHHGDLKADERSALIALLPHESRERVWLHALDGAAGLADELIAALVGGCPAPQTLSPALSRLLAAALLKRLQSQPLVHDWPLRAALPDLACLLHPSALPALRDLPRRADESPAEAEQIQQLGRIVDARLALARWTVPDRSPA
jgi:hypothetical protein